MNEVMNAIKTRRSIRSFEAKPVPHEILQMLVEAANDAPTAMNTQPWRFVVVTDQKFRQLLARTAAPNARKYFEPFKESNPERYAVIMKRFDEMPDPVYYSAPAIVFVIGSGPQASDACPMACLNIMLAARSLGLGTCWVKLGSLITENPEITQGLNLKDNEQIFGPIIVGYPKEIPEPPKKKDPAVIWI
jgi:nitroreductase